MRTGEACRCWRSWSKPAAPPTRGSRWCRWSRSATTTPSSKARKLSAALLATHLNGERFDLDHGYPLRLIAPNRAGVLNTKWLNRIEILS